MMMAQVCDLEPESLFIQWAMLISVNHLDQAREQLARDHREVLK